MAFSEFDAALVKAKIEAYIESSRPPKHLRNKIDLGFRLKNQSVEIFEISPSFSDPSMSLENSVAKTTYVKRANEWRIYWMPSDLTWHRYDPVPEVESIEEFINVIEKDEHACFWG